MAARPPGRCGADLIERMLSHRRTRSPLVEKIVRIAASGVDERRGRDADQAKLGCVGLASQKLAAGCENLCRELVGSESARAREIRGLKLERLSRQGPQP